MPRTYEYFYAADVITVVNDMEKLLPIAGPSPPPLPPVVIQFQERDDSEVEESEQSNILNGYLNEEGNERESLSSETENIEIEQPDSNIVPVEELEEEDEDEIKNKNKFKAPFNPLITDAKYYGKVWFYVACRFETNFLRNGDKYKDLGLYTDADLQPLTGFVTKRRYRQFSVAASQEIFRAASLIIIPLDPAILVPAYGQRFSITVPFSAILKFSDVRDKIEAWKFTIRVLDTDVVYVVLPGSVKLKHTRKINPI